MIVWSCSGDRAAAVDGNFVAHFYMVPIVMPCGDMGGLTDDGSQCRVVILAYISNSDICSDIYNWIGDSAMRCADC